MNDPAQPHPQNPFQPQPVSSSGATNKELEAGGSPVEVAGLKEVGKEKALSSEVTGTGVRIHPTSVMLPPKVAQMGVQPVGQSSPPPAVSVTLPLTDDQIAQGLTKDMKSSWRWLAEFCMRKIKQLHKKIVRSS